MHSPSPQDTSSRPILLNPVVAFFLYLGAAGIGLEMALWQQFAPLIWPPAGLGLALLLLAGPVHLPVIFLGAGLVRFLEGGALLDSVVFGFAYASVGGASWYLLRRVFRIRNSLERLIDVSAFLAVGVLFLPVISALLTTASIRWFTPEFCPDFFALFSVRWLSDALGVLVMTPFIVVWYSRTRINWRNQQSLEVLIWLAGLILLGALVFRNWAPTDTLRYPMELTMFPVMAWAAMRFGQRGVSVGIFLVSMMAVWELRDVIGPEATKTISQPPGYLWVFVGVLSTTALYLAATWTELRNREDEFRTSEERLRAFVQAIPDLALVFDSLGTCTELFAPANSRFRGQAQSFRGKSLAEIYPDDLARKFQETIGQVIASRKLEVIRYAISIGGDDRVFEGRFAPIEAFEDQLPTVMLVSYDLTDTQRTQVDLQRRDQFLKTLTQAESVLLREKVFHRGVRKAIECVGKGLSLDLVQVYRLHEEEAAEPVVEAVHGWVREGIDSLQEASLDVSHLQNLSPDWLEKLRSGDPWLLQITEGDEATRYFLNQFGMESMILFGIQPKGGALSFVAYGSTLEEPSGEGNFFAVLEAVSKSLRAYMETQIIQEELNAAKDAAIAADHAKGEFLAIMSHEIRTPMNAIIGFSELLRQTDVSDQQTEYVEIISRSGKDLLELINNILDFSKLESNSLELEQTRLNPESVVREAIDMVLFRAKEKGIALEFNASEEFKGLFWGDPLRLRQVLLNLLTNAIKFTHEGSVTVEIETLEVDQPWYTFEFRVKDTGIGIPEENRSDLFKAFRQVDSSSTREFGGTGLGLTIVQRLVDKMGGRVALESRVGEGSTFSFVLCFQQYSEAVLTEAPARGAEPLEEEFARKHPLSILVVEDDPMNTRLVCAILSKLGYEAEAVTDGFKALAVLTEARHNLVLMDMQMERLDGIETTRRIRSGDCGDQIRNVPVAALTALALDEEKERILQSGINYYLSKPLRLEELKQILRSVADSSRLT